MSVHNSFLPAPSWMEFQTNDTALDVSGSWAAPGTEHRSIDEDTGNGYGNKLQNPTACALAENQTATTAAGNPRQQIKWGIEISMSVMHYHFKVTNFENDMTSCHTKMYELFKIENPNVAVIEEHVADQHKTL